MRLVLDTDVVFSGLRSPTGASRLLLCAAFARAFVPLVSVTTMLEYEEVLTRTTSLAAIGATAADVTAFLDGLMVMSELVHISRSFRPTIRDPDDEMFVEALVNGMGDAVVTFNRRDYMSPDPLAASRGQTSVPVLAPGEVLGRLPWRPSAATLYTFRAP